MKNRYEIGEVVQWVAANKLFVGIYLERLCDKHSQFIIRNCDGLQMALKTKVETSKLKPITS